MGTGSFTVYDWAHPTVHPDQSTPARATAVKLETAIRRDRHETGAFIAGDGSIIVQKTELADQVTFGGAELVGTTQTLFTHNHPLDGSFSNGDVMAAIESQLIELRAVGPTLRYIMSARGGWWPSKITVEQAILKASPLATQETKMQMIAGLNPRFASLEFRHQLWREVAQRLNLCYMREKS